MDLIFDDHCLHEHDGEDEFNGYIDDGDVERITRHNEYDYDDDEILDNEGGNEKEI